jgi:iron(III) transport system substrate-binding protein
MAPIRTLLAFAFLTGAAAVACGGRSAEQPAAEQQTVTVYVSTDRVFSEPVLRAFEQRSGIRVNAVYDTEETKSTGLANRLLAERERAQADVFWSNEPVRTLVLQSRGVLAPYQSPSARDIPEAFRDPQGYWTAFSARVRVIAYNTKLVPEKAAPVSVLDLADPKWKGQVAIADPRFGSTSFHVAALYVTLGDDKADDFFRRLKANGVKIVAGNSVVRDMVVKGEVKVGLTDTDDVNVALESGAPIAMVMPDRDGMGVPMMPNMVSMVAGAPHPEEAKQMIDYLLSHDVERMLAKSEAVQIPLRLSVPAPVNLPRIDAFKPMTLDYGKAAARVEDVTGRLQTILGL